MTTRLSAASLGQLPPQVDVPAYPAEAAAIGVVHLGVGNFFRAHQAAYLDEALNGGAAGWGVCGVSLRNPATRDALLPQDNCYTLVERDANGDRARVIGSVRELLVAREDPAQVIARITAPKTRWVSLTITEKGYGHVAGSSSMQLDSAHPDVAHDLVRQQAPRSAVGLIHAGLLKRQRETAAPLTVLSCDNLSSNGDLLRALVLAFDAAVGGGSSSWIEDQVRFPNSMVDRIVPRTTQVERSLARELIGMEDAWPVVTEPFRQWVIEDRFAGPPPPLERYGVQIVADVRPFEAMKLRLLNAAHSAIAWLSVPAGLGTVDAAVAEPEMRDFIERLWLDVIPGLEPEAVNAAPAYCASLLARFANPGLAHQTAQIAMDGSQKLPLRLLPSIRANLALGLPVDRLALVLAAWIHYLRGVAEDGGAFQPDDPLRGPLQASARAPDADEAVRRVFRQPAIFGDLAENAALQKKVAACLRRLQSGGTLGALAWMKGSGSSSFT
ncbi:MAG: mannitol dehydrogenase family protein [Lautropia sp.]|nr:mannitol dehydrogenase family protein [Lautropia sp.]